MNAVQLAQKKILLVWKELNNMVKDKPSLKDHVEKEMGISPESIDKRKELYLSIAKMGISNEEIAFIIIGIDSF